MFLGHGLCHGVLRCSASSGGVGAAMRRPCGVVATAVAPRWPLSVRGSGAGPGHAGWRSCAGLAADEGESGGGERDERGERGGSSSSFAPATSEGRLTSARSEHALHSKDPSSSEVVESFSTDDVESFPRFQKQFVDRIWVEVKAGNGGNPALNAVRSPSMKGGGYAGHGGSVMLKATHLVESFLDVPEVLKGTHGGDGSDTHRGKHGKDNCLLVPLGTIVRQRVFSGERTEENRRIFVPQFRYQFLRHEDTFVVAKGGLGGVGPRSFKKGDGRKGTPGERSRLELELRLLNDCAFVGHPNAGKTSLLAALSRAHTRIGPEEYSTTRPHVGVIHFSDRVNIRLCDLPGVKRGAHLDKDMGRRILRHTYRSRVLCFCVDVARGAAPPEDPLEEVEALREEACLYDPLNRDKPWMVVGTKCDALHRDALFHLDSLHARLSARHGREVPVVGTSSRFGLGLTRMVRTIRGLLYPDNVMPVSRLPAMQVDMRLPGVLHERLDALPAPQTNLAQRLLPPPRASGR